MGNNDLNDMKTGRMDPEGEGMTRAGQICSIIATILGIIAVVIGFFFFVIAVSGPRGRW
jgi:hypothetical protein